MVSREKTQKQISLFQGVRTTIETSKTRAGSQQVCI